MAGHRRGTGRPAQAPARWQRRRDFYVARLARATTPSQRVIAAAEYVRGALTDLPSARAEQLATEVVRVLTGLVEQAHREETNA